MKVNTTYFRLLFVYVRGRCINLVVHVQGRLL